MQCAVSWYIVLPYILRVYNKKGPRCQQRSFFRKHNFFHNFYHFSALRWGRWSKSSLAEDKDQFILPSYLILLLPINAKSQGISSHGIDLVLWEYSGLSIRAAVGPRFNIKMLSFQYRKSHCEDQILVRHHLYTDLEHRRLISDHFSLIQYITWWVYFIKSMTKSPLFTSPFSSFL